MALDQGMILDQEKILGQGMILDPWKILDQVMILAQGKILVDLGKILDQVMILDQGEVNKILYPTRSLALTPATTTRPTLSLRSTSGPA